MIENLRPREGVRKLLIASGTLMSMATLFLFLNGTSPDAAPASSSGGAGGAHPLPERAHVAEHGPARAGDRAGPAPASFLEGAADTRATAGRGRETAKRLLLGLLCGREARRTAPQSELHSVSRSGAAREASGSSAAAEPGWARASTHPSGSSEISRHDARAVNAGPGATSESDAVDGEDAMPRAEVVARVEKAGGPGAHWVFRTEPLGRLYRVPDLPAASGTTSDESEERTGARLLREVGRTILDTGHRRYRVVDPPWPVVEGGKEELR